MQTLWLPSAKSRWGQLKDAAGSALGIACSDPLKTTKTPFIGVLSTLQSAPIHITAAQSRSSPYMTGKEKGKSSLSSNRKHPQAQRAQGEESGSRQQNSSPAIPGKDQSRMKQNPSGLERRPGSWRIIRRKGFSTLAWPFKHLHSTEKKGGGNGGRGIKLSESDE